MDKSEEIEPDSYHHFMSSRALRKKAHRRGVDWRKAEEQVEKELINHINPASINTELSCRSQQVQVGGGRIT